MNDRLTDTTLARASAAESRVERLDFPRAPSDPVALRTRLWKTLLGYRACTAGICDLVDAFAGGEATAPLTDLVRRNDSPAARDALAEELGRRDVEMKLADIVLADLTSHEMGCSDHAVMLRLSEVDCASAAFAVLVHTSRALYSAVWLDQTAA